MSNEEKSQDSETSSQNSSAGGGDTIPPFSGIEIIEVNRTNFSNIWPYLLVCVKAADFTAIDIEMSGLGGKGLRSKDVEERYRSIRDAAQSRSIVSLGICTMKLTHKSEKKRALRYETQVFNLLTFSEQPFTVEPSALQFLAKHSFDFNRLISDGVRFQGPNCPLKTLFRELLGSSATFCLHNGFIDLAFIHRQLYDVELPDTLDEFCNNLADLFPVDFLPIADSKYLAEFQTRMSASYLEYVFRRSQGDNEIERQARRYHLEIQFPASTNKSRTIKKALDTVDVKLPEGFPDHQIPIDLHNHVCKYFGAHGFCHQRNSEKGCKLMHDVDSAIDLQRIKENKKAFKRKRRYNAVIAEAAVEKIEGAEEEWKRNKLGDQLLTRDIKDQKRIAVSGLHRASVDAFMTAFSVVYQQRRSLMTADSVDKEFVNRLPLSAKDKPLHIRHRQLITPLSESHEKHEAAMVEINQMRDYVRKNAASAVLAD